MRKFLPLVAVSTLAGINATANAAGTDIETVATAAIAAAAATGLVILGAMVTGGAGVNVLKRVASKFGLTL